MPVTGKGTQYQSPLIVQLVKNREEQLTAEAQKNPETGDHDPPFLTRQPTQRIDFGPVMEWVGVFLQVFWLSLLSGSFLFLWVFVLKLAGY
jgi:hypothetical protein